MIVRWASCSLPFYLFVRWLGLAGAGKESELGVSMWGLIMMGEGWVNDQWVSGTLGFGLML
jgi:hypothetical protein